METTETISSLVDVLDSWGPFKYYECYDRFGRVRYMISRENLNTALIAFEILGTLYRGAWELRIGDGPECIEARLNEQFQFDGKESDWRRPDLTFVSVR